MNNLSTAAESFLSEEKEKSFARVFYIEMFEYSQRRWSFVLLTRSVN